MKPTPLLPNPKLIDRIEHGLQWAFVLGDCRFKGPPDGKRPLHRALIRRTSGALSTTYASKGTIRNPVIWLICRHSAGRISI
jgi:hypothetical protein